MANEAPRLLIVDDDEMNRAILRNLFERTYPVEESENGRDALRRIMANPDDYCAVLLDVVMPEMDGLEVLRCLTRAGLARSLPVFLITAEPGDATMREAYLLGVMDVIGKPVVPYVIQRRVNSVVELFETRKRLDHVVAQQHNALVAQERKITRLNRGLIESLATAIEFRDAESGDHVRRMHDITRILLAETALGNGMSEHQIEDIALAAVLHDVGKIAIPDAILNKPARLTAEEFELMKTHTTQGAQLIERIPQLHDSDTYRFACDIARHHHERWDGRGYPDQLTGSQITVWSQVVSLADVYDALSCKRVYKDAYPRPTVLKMIREGACGTFNPQLLQCFFEVEDALAALYVTDKEDA